MTQSNTVRIAIVRTFLSIGVIAALSGPSFAQTPKPAPRDNAPSSTSVPLPSDYVIGIEDVLSVVFWRDKEMSGEAVVRPDGKISLPMLNDIPAAGLTPEALATTIAKAATKFVKD